MASRMMALRLQTCLQSGSSSMLVSFCSSAAFSAELRACCGAPESPQNQFHSRFPKDLCRAEWQAIMREGQDREGRKDGQRGGWTRDERVGDAKTWKEWGTCGEDIL